MLVFSFLLPLSSNIRKSNPCLHCYFLKVSVIYWVVIFLVNELKRVIVSNLLVFRFKLKILWQYLVLKWLGVLSHYLRVIVDQASQTFNLEIPGFVNRRHQKLLGNSFDNSLPKCIVPILWKLFVELFYLFRTKDTSTCTRVLINKSIQNSGCPFLSMKIEEFHCTFILKLLYFAL